MLRILFHIHALNIGGAERQLTYLVKGLVERGCDVHVVTLYPGGRFWQELEDWGGCSLYSLNRKGKWDFSVVAKLVRYIRLHPIDLVQGWMAPCNSFAALAAKLTGIPMYMTIRASNAEYGFGGRMYARADKAVANWLVKRVIFNSYAGCNYHLSLGYQKEKSMVIPNGLSIPKNLSFPEPFQHELPWRIGMIARLVPMKDQVMMFAALQLLLQRGMAVELHLYGDGAADYKRQIKDEAEKLGVDAQIHWHGFTSDVWGVLGQLDIVSSSSSYGEGMSNTLLEAMMAKRPIVATDVGDAKSMLRGEAGRCGEIVPAKDARAMAEAILALIQSPADAVKMGEKARGIAASEYSVNAMVERYDRIYNEIHVK